MRVSSDDGKHMRVITPKRRWRRRVLYFLLLVACAFTAHWEWGDYNRARWEDTVEQHRAAGEAMDYAALIGPKPADDQNAAVDLIAAGNLIDTKSNIWRKYYALESDLPLDQSDMIIIAQMLDASRDALRRLDRAMAKPAVYWAWSDPDRLTCEAPWSHCRSLLPELLKYAALRAHQLGDDREALRRIRQILFIANAVDRDPMMSAHYAALRARAVASDVILQIAMHIHLDDDSAQTPLKVDIRTVIDELLDDQRSQAAVIRALEGGRVESRVHFSSVASGNPKIVWGKTDDFAVKCRNYALGPIDFADGVAMLDYCDRVIAVAQSGGQWPEMSARIATLSFPQEIRESPFLHFPALMIYPRADIELRNHFRILTENHITATALAIGCFMSDHNGQLPASLDELLPDYLDDLPSDLMSTGGPRLGYRADTADPVLYSVGDDGIDDHGSEETKHKYIDPPRFNWEMRDMVVHLRARPARHK